MIPDNLFERITKDMASTGVAKAISDAEVVIAGFSGGADSSFLLCFLADYLKDTDKKLTAAHFNHMIRGAEADRDEEFCRTVCREAGIEFVSGRADIPSIATDSGEGLEEAARHERYKFFNKIVEERYPGKKVVVATAHNADDNLETILLNMMRGCGTDGLAGIPPVRDGLYVRPILCLSGEEIRNACGEIGIQYIKDSTNDDNDYRRNYVRNTVVPALKKLNEDPAQTVYSMSSIIRDDCAYLNRQAETILGGNREGCRLDILAGCDRQIASRILRILYKEKSPTTATLTLSNVTEILDQIYSGTFRRISLPGKMEAYNKDGVIVFEYDARKDVPESYEYVLHFGENDYPEQGFSILFTDKKEEIDKKDKNIYKLSIFKSFNFDTIKGQAIVRTRKPGDTYFYGGVNRKLKKLLCDKKVPEEERDILPIITDDDGILWIPGFQQRDGTKPDADKKTVYFAYYRY